MLSAKLTSLVAGTVFGLVTGSDESGEICSGICEWLFSRNASKETTSLRSISEDLATELASVVQQWSNIPSSRGADEPDAILTSALTAIRKGPELYELVEKHGSSPERIALVVKAILSASFRNTADPVRERAEIVVDLFYRRLLDHPDCNALTEGRFRAALWSAIAEISSAIRFGNETLERLLVGFPKELSPALRSAASSFLLNPRRLEWQTLSDTEAVNSSLLLPEHRVLPFEDVGDLLEETYNWCKLERNMSLRLLVGAGGIGKTRLSIELCDRLWRNDAWRAGFLEPTASANAEILYAALLEDPRPLLIIFDHAELQVPAIQMFIQRARRRWREDPEHASKLRMLLLSRDAGDWWKSDLAAADGEVPAFVEAERATPRAVIRLLPIADSIDTRVKLFDRWRIAFAAKLKLAYLSEVRSAWRDLIGQPGMDRSLFLSLAALASVTSQDGEVPASVESLLRETLARERHLWRRSVESSLISGLADGLATVTMLRGIRGELQLRDVLRQLVSLDGQPQSAISHIARILKSLYPADDTLSIAALKPDLLGEYFVYQRLQAEPTLVAQVMRIRGVDAESVLTTLTRMTQSWRGIVPEVVRCATDQLESIDLLQSTPRMYACINVAISTGDPIGKILARVIVEKGDVHIAERALGYSNSRCDVMKFDVMALRELNAEAATLIDRQFDTEDE